MNVSVAMQDAIRRLKTDHNWSYFSNLDHRGACEDDFDYLRGDACHDLTRALLEVSPDCQILVIRDYMDDIQYSAIYCPETDMTLGGDGLLTREKLIYEWENRGFDECTGRIHPKEFIEQLSNEDSQAQDQAMQAFERILQIMPWVGYE